MIGRGYVTTVVERTPSEPLLFQAVYSLSPTSALTAGGRTLSGGTPRQYLAPSPVETPMTQPAVRSDTGRHKSSAPSGIHRPSKLVRSLLSQSREASAVELVIVD